MPQITAYVNKSDHERWMRVERKADVVKWLLDRYEAGDIELPTKTKKPDKQIPKVPDSDLFPKGAVNKRRGVDAIGIPMGSGVAISQPTQPKRVIKTPEDAKAAVGPITPHQNFFKKPKKK